MNNPDPENREPDDPTTEPENGVETSDGDQTPSADPSPGDDNATPIDTDVDEVPSDSDSADRQRRPLVARFGEYLVTANTVMVTVYSLILSIIIGGILIILADETVRGTFGYFFSRPADAIQASWTAVSEAYAGLFRGSIVDPGTFADWLAGSQSFSQVFYPISETLTYAAPLIMTGLAVGLAFRAGLFNIGAEGQVIIGAIGAGIIGFGVDLPAYIHIPLVLLAGALAGGLFGAVPGILKARTGAHEVITSIMLNYVALNFLGWVVHLKLVEDTKVHDQSKAVTESARMPQIFGADLRANLSFLLAIAVGVGVWWLLSRSTLGYRMRAVGLNPNASRTAGMSVPRTFVTSMATAGGLAGLGGAISVAGMGIPYALSDSVSGNVGFDGITVALLGRAKPGGIIAAGILFGALRAGTSLMQPQVPIDMVVVLQAVIVIFIAAPAMVKTLLRLRTPEGGLATTTAKGW